MRGLLIGIAVVIMASPATAQERQGFDLSANVRLRYETIDGQARAGTPPSEASTQLRTIVAACYRTGAFTIEGELIDSRALDVRTPSAITTAEVDTLEPVQLHLGYAFGKPGDPISGRITAGRMTLDLGSRRLVARDDFRNTVQGFDGVRVDLMHGSRVQSTLIYMLVQQRLPGDAGGLRSGRVELDHDGADQRLWGGVVTGKRIAGGSLDLTYYRFEERDRPGVATRDRRLDTVGARLVRAATPGSFDYEVEGFRQTGTIAASLAPTAGVLPVSAWFAHARLGYQWRGRWTPRLAAEFDYASGSGRGGRFGRFDTLFGMRRADFGPAGLYNATTRTNIVSPGVRVEVTPSKRLDAFATVRGLWLASRQDAFASTGVIDPSGASGLHAGTQLDGRVRWWAVPKILQFEIDAALIAKGRFLRTAPNRAAGSDTRYLALNGTVFF